MKIRRRYALLSGFTLIELMMVVSIIGILSTVVTFSVRDSGTVSRDTQRQADLRNLQVAIESYKHENGRYPAQCASGAGAAGWSGQLGTIYACSDGTRDYILGLAPKYIRTLPIDKKLNGTDSGYIYATNALGTVYKIKAQRTVEAEIGLIDFEHPFRSCDIRVVHAANGSLSSNLQDPDIIGFCGRSQNVGSNALGTRTLLPQCRSNNEGWSMSYALWGGFAPLNPSSRTTTVGLTDNEKAQALRFTTDIICK